MNQDEITSRQIALTHAAQLRSEPTLHNGVTVAGTLTDPAEIVAAAEIFRQFLMDDA